MFGKEKDIANKLKGEDAKWFSEFERTVNNSSEVNRADIKVLRVEDYYTIRLFDIDWVRWNFNSSPKWFEMHIPEQNQDDDLYERVTGKDRFLWKIFVDGADDYTYHMEAFYNRMYEIIDKVKYGK